MKIPNKPINNNTEIKNKNFFFVSFFFSIFTLLSNILISTIFQKTDNREKVIIYGAGEAGRVLSIVLSQSKKYLPVALIDDSTEIQGKTINGLEVISPDHLNKIIVKQNIQ